MRKLDYRAVEGVLYDYRNLKAKLSNAKRRREEILNLEVGVGTLHYGDIPGGKTNKIQSPVESALEFRDRLLAPIDAEIKELENLFYRIETSLAALSEEERSILKLFYMEGRTWHQVANTLRFSVSWCKKKRSKAIESMVKTING